MWRPHFSHMSEFMCVFVFWRTHFFPTCGDPHFSQLLGVLHDKRRVLASKGGELFTSDGGHAVVDANGEMWELEADAHLDGDDETRASSDSRVDGGRPASERRRRSEGSSPPSSALSRVSSCMVRSPALFASLVLLVVLALASAAVVPWLDDDAASRFDRPHVLGHVKSARTVADLAARLAARYARERAAASAGARELTSAADGAAAQQVCVDYLLVLVSLN